MTPFVGEIRIFAGNFAPAGWMFCNGQLLPISENDTLFTLIGTTYGGDGESTFGLPDLQGRLPIHFGNGYQLGETGGAESITLTTNQIPWHNHSFVASSGAGSQANPVNNVPAASPSISLYVEEVPAASMNSNAVTYVGGNQPHDNFQPYLCVSFIISLFGIFPSQN